MKLLKLTEVTGPQSQQILLVNPDQIVCIYPLVDEISGANTDIRLADNLLYSVVETAQQIEKKIEDLFYERP